MFDIGILRLEILRLRDESLDYLRGIGVLLIHFVDVFQLLWNRNSGIDVFNLELYGGFTLAGVAPLIFSFSTGLALHHWKDKHDFKYLLKRISLLLVSGLILSYVIDHDILAFGIFELIAVSNLILYYFNSVTISISGILLILLMKVICPMNFPLPIIMNRIFFTGIFPLVPFLAYAWYGCLYGKMKDYRISLLSLVFGILLFPTPLQDVSIILLNCGLASILYEVMKKVTVPYLNLYGVYSWRMTFWRYFLSYLPLIWLGLARRLDNPISIILSVLISACQGLLLLIKV